MDQTVGWWVISGERAEDAAMFLSEAKTGRSKTLEIGYKNYVSIPRTAFDELKDYHARRGTNEGGDEKLESILAEAREKYGVEIVYTFYSRANPLKLAREAAGLTQAQLADASGLHVVKISRIERGEIKLGNIALSTAVALADALDIRPEELLGKSRIN